MSKKCVLALLVVLALSLAVYTVPAGSATLQRTSVAMNDKATDGPSFDKGEAGGGIDGGDDDRWGDSNPFDQDDTSTDGDTDGDGEDELSFKARMASKSEALRMRLRFMFRFLALLF